MDIGNKNLSLKLPQVNNPEEWRRVRKDILKNWLIHLGGMPEQIAGETQVVSEEKTGALIRQKIRYSTGKGFYTEAYVIRPARIRRKMPAVLVFHSTQDSTIEEPSGIDKTLISARYTALHLARRGYVTISPRCFIFDNAPVSAPPDIAGRKKLVRKVKRYNPGWTGMTKMLSDGMRAIDILESYPFVDRGRIGCIGFSLGAKESLYMAAFDERIKACVCNEAGIGISFSNWDAPWYLGAGIRKEKDMDHHQLIALIAPRAFLLVGGEGEDGERSVPYVEAARPLYRILGAEDSLRIILHKKGHLCVPSVNAKVYRWLDLRLGNA
ncbi:MAG: acetylxylan esterase [Candidatus Omnitrophica bacterium]|nr:acetylxylan esterase [Candidatus Omnitrophota bacterium]